MLPTSPLVRAGLVCLMGLLAAGCRAQLLPGFVLTGEYWSYDPGDGGAIITGILSRPATNGSLPAVLISHGKGSSAAGFALPKARVMTNWGAVCIAPNYTHASTTNAPENEGWCPENSRRARACLKILASLGYVDMSRVAAYGNSMGAYVTAGLCGEITNQIRAAAITAGGTSGTTNTQSASPATQEVQGIVSPFLMLHGTADTTVPPAQSAALQSILTSNGVPNDRVLFDGIGHDLHNNPATSNTVLELIRNWFARWGVLAGTNPPGAMVRRPRGLFVLDSAAGTQINGVSMRDANLRSYAFLSGYVLRVAWSTLEPAQEVYDFTIISNILVHLEPLRQKLSLILVPPEPPYIAATPGVTTWQDLDRNGNPLTRAVPWDPFLLQQRAKFLAALATNRFGGIPFRDHPLLYAINPYLPGGFTGIRDPNTVRLRDLPGYTRSNLLAAVQHELRALTAGFPDKFVQIGFWKVTDYENASYGGMEAWEFLRQQLLAEFNGAARPRVGLFMENLAASRPAPGQDPVTGYPVSAFGAPLFLSQTNTWAAFQALGSWSQPFNPAHLDNTTNGTPADGIAWGFETYGCTYFELYVSDVDHAPYQEALRQWQQKLTAPELRLQMPDALRLRWERASPLTVVAIASNVAGPYAPLAWLTNRFEWTNTASVGPARYFRAWQTE